MKGLHFLPRASLLFSVEMEVKLCYFQRMNGRFISYKILSLFFCFREYKILQPDLSNRKRKQLVLCNTAAMASNHRWVSLFVGTDR
jgi:hypothetical protein